MTNVKNKTKVANRRVKLSALAVCIYACCQTSLVAADDIEFNTDVLDVKDKANIDLSQFSKRGYIMPGEYTFKITINENELEEQDIKVYASDIDKNDSRACLTPELIKKFGFKERYTKEFSLWHQNQCVDITALKGVEVHPDLSAAILAVSVPQAYMEYVSDNWVPSSMWDDGVPGVLADYNVNAQTRKNNEAGNQNTVSGNGTLGINVGAWRARADWQGSYDSESDSSADAARKNMTLTRAYLYRALRGLKAKLTLGEDYVNSDLIDSFRFAGASIVSDDNMLPPNLRGYAPEVTGLAKTNAKVVISQQGRVIYQTQVAAGPFAIQDLSTAVSGDLDVRVEEQDGSVQEYKVSTANIPYLTRPGQVRYKLYAGKPTDYDHKAHGDTFAASEFSVGISNGWSIYGGAITSSKYIALTAGIGRDLMALGAVALDVTRSDAKLDQEHRHGQSYRVSYSKRFDDTGSQVTFAGYRFSEKDFMSFNDYLQYRSHDDDYMRSKEMYTVTFSQQFESLGLSAYLNYSHQTYWNNPTEDRYSLALSRYFDIGKMKNISGSLTAYRNKFNEKNDDGIYFSVAVPWGDAGTLSYNASMDGEADSHNVAYYERLKNGDNYRISAGASDNGSSLNGYYDHLSDIVEVTTNLDYQHNKYSSAGMTLRGGMTATAQGAALHRTNMMGGSRVLLDTGDTAGIPVQGYSSSTHTNRFGKAVVADVNDYNKNSLNIDINQLPEDAEATGSVVQATLTEGAIGYRKFNVVSGLKAMAIIRLADGSYPPFGATIHNEAGQETGIINDEGQVYLSGLKSGVKMNASWNGKVQCTFSIPDKLTASSENENLLLPCQQ